ncbi:MAG TPA: YfhO family protein [bacterium]|nr:YfhO family protein [bacterium]
MSPGQVKNLILKNERWAFLVAGTMISAIVFIPWALGLLPCDYTQGEMITQWMPFRVFMGDCCRGGVFPLWNPYIFGGMPFWAFSHTMSAYPVMALSLLLPLVSGINAFYVFHIYLMSWGVFRLLRHLGLGPALSFAGVFLMAGNGWAMFTRDFYIALASASWFPVLLYLGIRALETASLRSLAAWTMALSLQFLIGDVEGSCYTMAFMPLFIALAWPGFKPSLKRGRPALLLGGFALAFIIASMMWMPLSEYFPFNVRANGVAFNLYADLAAHHKSRGLIKLMAVFLPLLQRHPLRSVTLFFLAYHLLVTRRKASWALFGACLIAGTFAGRSSLFMERIWHAVPLMGIFMRRVDANNEIIFILHWLALMGARDFIGSPLASKNRYAVAALAAFAAMDTAGAIYVGRSVLGILPLLFAVLLVLMMMRPGRSWPRLAPLMVAAIIIAANFVPLLLNMRESDPKDLQSSPAGRAFALMDRPSRYLIAANLAVSAPHLYTQESMVRQRPEVFGWNRVPPRRYLDVIALIDPAIIAYDNGKLAGMDFVFGHMNGSLLRGNALDLLDLLSVRYLFDQHIPVKWTSPQDVYWLLDPRQLKDRLFPGQWLDLKADRAPLTFTLQPGPAAQLAFSMAADPVSGSPPAVSCRVRISAGATILLDQEMELRPGPGGQYLSAPVSVSLAALQGRPAAIAVSVEPGPDSRPMQLRFRRFLIVDPQKPFQMIFSCDEFDLFENRGALPEAFLAGRVMVMAGKDAVLDRLRQANREELASTLFLVDGPESRRLTQWVSPISFPLTAGRVSEQISLPGRRVFAVESPTRSIFFLSQNLLPGWRAWVDGVETRLAPADWAFTAAPVDAGMHKLELKYRPQAFRIAVFVSSASFLMLLILAALPGRRSPSPGQDEKPAARH